MGLDDFTSGDSSKSTHDSDKDEKGGNKKRSQMFTKQRFEEVLEETSYDWKAKKYDWTKEWIYEAESASGRFIMRIYSSVDRRTDKSRKKDSDAIRLVVLEADSERPVMKEKRTNRIKTWPKNLKKKIAHISNRKDELNFCDNCSSVMVIRENKDNGNRFLGCSAYPDCRYTESL